MTAKPAPIAVIRDDALPPEQLDALLAHAVSKEADFIEAGLVRNDAGAAVTVDRSFRYNKQLRGASSLPDPTMSELRALVPALASELPGMRASEVADGTFEAFITATPNGGFFRPHVDDSHEGARDRFISFVLYFSRVPRPFTGGELCIERDWKDTDRLFLFDAGRNGFDHPDIADVVVPVPNRLVVFGAHRRHEIRPVRSTSNQFADSRFTVTGFVRSGTRDVPHPA